LDKFYASRLTADKFALLYHTLNPVTCLTKASLSKEIYTAHNFGEKTAEFEAQEFGWELK